MRIALDAMGGDYAPAEIVKGALAAVKELNCNVTLVGDPEAIQRCLPDNYPKDKISIHPASESITMDEDPAKAIRKKKDCSINVAFQLVKENKADGFISAGNTGACMAGALLNLGRISGIERPAIATIFPTYKSRVVLLDMGANSDCKPHYLTQFAMMGSIYAEQVLGINNPRVSLLNIGEEEEKGNNLTHEAAEEIKSLPINFIGNIEGHHILEDKTDVVVCEGFVGNIVLKFAQGVTRFIMTLFRHEIKKTWVSKLGTLFLLPAFRQIRKKIDYTEYGGAPLLGVKGVCMITHGRSKAKAIKNAIRTTLHYADTHAVEKITDFVEKYR